MIEQNILDMIRTGKHGRMIGENIIAELYEEIRHLEARVSKTIDEIQGVCKDHPELAQAQCCEILEKKEQRIKEIKEEILKVESILHT